MIMRKSKTIAAIVLFSIVSNAQFVKKTWAIESRRDPINRPK